MEKKHLFAKISMQLLQNHPYFSVCSQFCAMPYVYGWELSAKKEAAINN